MLYRLRPPDRLDRAEGVPMGTGEIHWTEDGERAFSLDLLALALRYGRMIPGGLVLDSVHTADLGRADAVRSTQMSLDEIDADYDASADGEMIETLRPGSRARREEVRRSQRAHTEETARSAEIAVRQALAAPIRPDLLAHWTTFGGSAPGRLM